MKRYKIAQDKRREITQRYIETPVTYEQLAEELGVSMSTIASSIRSIDPKAGDKKRRRRGRTVTEWSSGHDEARKVPREDYLKIARRYIESDLTYQDIGDEYGVSRERIRQIIAEVAPNAFDQKRQHAEAEAKAKEAAEFIEACLDAMLYGRICAVCGSWVLRKRAEVTCSEECSDAWAVLRTLPEIDGGEHRKAVARAILRHPDQYDDDQIEHAIQVLEGKPPVRRRYLHKGSKRAEVVRRWRPELYEELTGEPA